MNPAISIRDICFRWKADLPPTVQIDHFEIVPGSRVFLRGPSGSGKTTLLGLIGGVLVPERGTIQIQGTNLCALRPQARDKFRADHVGYIFQMFNLLPYLSVLDNITLPAHFSPNRAARVKGDWNTEARALVAALGLPESLLHRPVTELSVGQQQRAAAARSLLGAPDLVIADEPTSALDTENREGFLRLLFEQCKKAQSTLLFVSHDKSLAPMFDEVVDLADINRVAS